jgi:hypothetical protein
MQHYATLFHVLVIAKNKIYCILQVDKQAHAFMQQFKKIKLEFRYNINVGQVAGKYFHLLSFPELQHNVLHVFCNLFLSQIIH